MKRLLLEELEQNDDSDASFRERTYESYDEIESTEETRKLKKGTFHWHPAYGLTFVKDKGLIQLEKKKCIDEIVDGIFQVGFERRVPEEGIEHFRQAFHEGENPADTEISLVDIKNAVLFTALTDIKPDVARFLHSYSMDLFIRSLIVYMQYYLFIRETVKERELDYKTKLRHPTSAMKEAIWSNNLNDMRYVVGRNFSYLVAGEKDAWGSHHMNNKMHVSMSKSDANVYNIFFSVLTRIVCVALGSPNHPQIREEMKRLFIVGESENGNHDLSPLSRDILEKKLPASNRLLERRAPILMELNRPGRDPKLLFLGLHPLADPTERLAALELAYVCPDKLLVKCNIRLGILGSRKEEYGPLLIPYRDILGEGTWRMEMAVLRVNELELSGKDASEATFEDVVKTESQEDRIEKLKLPVSKWDYSKPYKVAPNSLNFKPRVEHAALKSWLRLGLAKARYKSFKGDRKRSWDPKSFGDDDEVLRRRAEEEEFEGEFEGEMEGELEGEWEGEMEGELEEELEEESEEESEEEELEGEFDEELEGEFKEEELEGEFKEDKLKPGLEGEVDEGSEEESEDESEEESEDEWEVGSEERSEDNFEKEKRQDKLREEFLKKRTPSGSRSTLASGSRAGSSGTGRSRTTSSSSSSSRTSSSRTTSTTETTSSSSGSGSSSRSSRTASGSLRSH